MPDDTKLRDLQSQFGKMTDQLARYEKSLGGLAKTNRDFAVDMAKLVRATYDGGKSFGLLDKDTKALTDTVKKHIQAMRDQEVAAKRMAIAYGIVAFKAGDMHTKLRMVGMGVDKIGLGFKKTAEYLSRGSGSVLFSLQHVREELTKYNRAAFETSRQMQVMGQRFDASKLDKMASSANLSRRQMSELVKSFNEVSNAGAKSFGKIGSLAELASKNFGGSADVIMEMTRRFGELDGILPGLTEDMARFSQTGQSSVKNMGSLMLTMKNMGATTRQIFTMAQAYRNVTKEQKDLLSYETAIQARQAAVADANLAAGKNSETALIGIEKAMTYLVQKGDKMINMFSGIPMVLMSLQAIGITSALGVANAFKVAMQSAAAFSVKVKEAGTEIDTVNQKASSGPLAGRMWGGATSGAGKAASVAGLGLSLGLSASKLYQGYTEGDYRGGEGGLAEAAARGGGSWQKKAAGYAGLAGTVIGGTIGFIGGAGAGVVPGAAAGGLVGGMAGMALEQFGGGDNEKLQGMAKAIDSVKDSGKLKIDKGIRIQSEGDIYNLLLKQEKTEQKILMIDALIEGALVDEKEIRKSVGNELVDQWQTKKKIRDEEEKLEEAVMANFRNYEKSADQLKKMEDSYSKIVSYAQSMRETFTANAFAVTDSAYWAGQQKKALEDQLLTIREQRKELENFETGSMAEATQAALEGRMGNVGINDQAKRQLIDSLKEIKEASSAGSDIDATPQQREAAKKKADDLRKQYTELVKQLGVAEKLKKLGMDDVSNAEKRASDIDKANRQARLLEANTKERKLHLQVINATITENVAKQTGEEAMLANIQEYEQSRADLMGKTAVGYAMHFQAEKKVFDQITKRRDLVDEIIKKNKAAAAEDIKRFASGALKGTGITEGMMSKAIGRDETAMRRLNEEKQKLIASGADMNDPKIKALDTIVEYQKVVMENEKKLLELDKQRIDKAMALREGYLDVINEMTTGGDLVSRLVADSSRGLVSLQQMQMVHTGEKIGGASTRGFATINPFQQSMSMAGAAKFTAQGFQGPGSMAGTLPEAYFAGLMGLEKAEKKRGGPEFFSGIDPGKGAAYENNPKRGTAMASGGRIPGHSSSADNRLGIIDGKDPIKVASGEYVVNAKATAQNLSLLESINKGYANGSDGPINWSDYDANKEIRDAVFRRLEDYDKREAREARRSIIRGRFNKRAQKEAASEAWKDEMGAGLLSAGEQAYRGIGGAVASIKGLFTGDTFATGLKRTLNKGNAGSPTSRGRRASLLARSGRINAASQNSIYASRPNLTEFEAGQIYVADRAAVAKRASGLSSMPGYSDFVAANQESLSASAKGFDDMISNRRARRVADREASREVIHGNQWYAGRERRKAGTEEMIAFNDAMKEKRRTEMAQLMGGSTALAAGGLVNSVANAMSISGGMRIGTLMLNGKVIGQDMNGGSGSEWKVAAQNAYG
jgi:hypothetical protein